MKNLAVSRKITYPFILYLEIEILEPIPQDTLANQKMTCALFCLLALFFKAKDWKESGSHQRGATPVTILGPSEYSAAVSRDEKELYELLTVSDLHAYFSVTKGGSERTLSRECYLS